MISRNINIYFQLLIIFVFGVIDKNAYSQENSIENSFEIRVLKNLESLDAMYCWGEKDFFPGKFQMIETTDFKSDYEKLNLSIFPNATLQAKEFYFFLNQLPLNERQNLVRYFTYYESYFEMILKSAGLPQDLKYLAPAFSSMNTNFAGADRKAGLWQLTHFQGVLNGLQINRLVDERLNEHLSTRCYAQVVSQNVKLFGSTELAVLGQLFGNTKIQNAIVLAGNKKSYSDLRPYLPDSVIQYIAAYQATALFLTVNTFKPDREVLIGSTNPDTVKINRQLHFKQVSEVLNVPAPQLQFLNPQYRFQIVPGNEKVQKLALPNGFRDDFVIWQDSVYQTYDSTLFNIVAQKIEYPPAPNRQYLGEPVKDLEIEGKTKIQYQLKTGDVLGIIAEKYDVNVTDLKYWNNIYNERRIQAGKKIDIFVDDDKVDYYLNMDSENGATQDASDNMVAKNQQNSTPNVFEDLSSATKIEHTVKSGESPYTIAKKYNDVTPEQILEWNHIDNARKIQIGQKLIIYQKK